jgi:PAP2 superfamily
VRASTLDPDMESLRRLWTRIGWEVRGVLIVLYVAGTLGWTNALARQRNPGFKYKKAFDYLGAIPINREIIVLWMLGLFIVTLIGRPFREWRNTVVSWAPFLLALFLYDFARSVGFRLHGNEPMMVVPQIRADEFFGGGRLPTTILQERFYDPDHIRWYDVLVSAIYTSHFLVPYLFAGFLWLRGKRLWRWYAGTFVSVNFFSCVIFAAVTTAPPWYAAQNGLIPEFERVIAGRGWGRVGLHLMDSVIKKGQRTVNPFAAIPSLHSAQAFLIVVCVWPLVWKWVRPFLLLYPLAMTFALVYAGEHYFVDVLVGWVIVGVALLIGVWLRKRFGWVSPFEHPKMQLATEPILAPEPQTPVAVPA